VEYSVALFGFTMTDQYVYVRDKKYQWVPALLIDQTKTEATVSVAQYNNETEITGDNDHCNNTTKLTVKLKDYPNKALPLQNLVNGQVKQVADMIDLSFLHEAAILYNIKTRHIKSMPYTRTGDIVIAVNPYQWFPTLYTEENCTRYSRALVWEANKKDYDPRQDLPPHVYETSALAYKGLSLGGIHQSILVSGESGAGKTETVKICMNHLASVVQQEHNQDGDMSQDQKVVARVLESNPLLEAFGNAKTPRNDNSSRFGKYIQLQFDRGAHSSSHLTLLGSECQVYLLEKNRVVRHEDEERTFHIFYQLLAAPDSVKAKFWKKLKGTNYSSFVYVGDTDTTSIEGVSDADQFQHTVNSLEIIDIDGELLQSLMQAICVVLQLGNIVFGPHPKDSDHSVIISKGELTDLADLMGIPLDKLEITLTQRIVKVQKEETMVPLSPEAAKDSTDALAKQIYDRVFLWLVRNINQATTAGDEEDRFGMIGLLDIFGFESFPVNSFEQLCINYANEQLQQKFTKDVFVSVFEEYKEEDISLDEITYDDNTHVLDLIQNRTGLLAMLNEECIRPNGSDYGFVNKALHANKGSPALIIPRIVHSNVEFGIRHYAGNVMYDATDFVAKNQDTLPSDLMECACTSTNEIIAKHLSVVGAPTSTKRREVPSRKASNLVAPTAWSKYKDQLNRLMVDLHQTQSRYIRCVKPNGVKKPRIMEHEMTLQQLRSSGVISAVTLARSAFPNRLEHVLILDRFYPLWPPCKKCSTKSDAVTHQKESEILLTYALKAMESDGVMAFVIGNHRAYFRAGALEFLEAARLKGMEGPATIIQSLVRGYLARRLAYKLRHKTELAQLDFRNEKAKVIQCAGRSYVARKFTKKLRKEAKSKVKKKKEEKRRQRAAVKMQCAVRVFLSSKQREKRYVQYIKDQAKLLKKQKKLKKLDTAATVIQKHMRGAYIRIRYTKVLEKSKERARLKEKIEKIKKKTAKAEKTRKKELGKVKHGIDDERAGREAWEESILAATNEAAQTETAKLVELVQGEHRKLQIKTKTLDGMIKPLKKNFEVLMEENQELRDEFAEIHKKNEAMKAANTEVIERRNTAEQKTKELKEELKSVSNKFMPIAHGRLDFQKALKEILELLEKRCKNDQLIEDVTMLAYQCQAEANTLQAGADAAKEFDLACSPKKGRKSLGGSFSMIAVPKTTPPAKSKSAKSRRRTVQGSLSGLSGLLTPELAPGEKTERRNTSFDAESKSKSKK
jgi:myosin-5